MMVAAAGAHAQGNSLKTFVGKYKVSQDNCDMYSLDNHVRAYAEVQNNAKTGAERLVINFYGSDASMFIIEADQGLSEDQGTVRTWSMAWTSENTIRQVTTGASTKRNVVYYEIDSVTKQGNRLILSNELSSGRTARVNKCVLTVDNS